MAVKGERDQKDRWDRELLLTSLVVWAAIAASLIAMVAYTGVPGAVFAFIVLVVAVPVWSRVVRDRWTSWRGQQDEDIKGQIEELNRKIEELKKMLEE